MVIKSLWMLVSTLMFSLMFVFSKICTDTVSVYEIMVYRAVIGLAFISVILYKKGIPMATRHPWAHFKRSTSGTLSLFCELTALGLLPLGLEQTLGYTTPLIFSTFVIFECLRDKKGIDWPLLGTVLVGFIGVILIIRPDVSGINPIGVLFALGAATFAATSSLLLRHLARYNEPAERTVFYFMLYNLVVGMIGTSFTTGFSMLTSEILYALLGVGIAGVLAQITVTFAWTYGHPLVNSVFQFSGIIFAVLFGVILFSEVIDGITLLGIATVLGAGMTAALLRRNS